MYSSCVGSPSATAACPTAATAAAPSAAPSSGASEATNGVAGRDCVRAAAIRDSIVCTATISDAISIAGSISSYAWALPTCAQA